MYVTQIKLSFRDVTYPSLATIETYLGPMNPSWLALVG